MDFRTIRRFAAIAASLGVFAATVPDQASAGRVVRAQAFGDIAASQQLLYAANINGPNRLGEILVFSANIRSGPHRPIRAITAGANRPNGLWVDGAGVLYVVNEGTGAPASLTEFKPGASTPFRTITDGLMVPETVAVDATGTVYVNDRANNTGQVTVYAPGSVHPARRIALNIQGYDLQADGMAFDKSGNLLVAIDLPSRALHIFKIAPGASKATELQLDLSGLTGPGLGVDGAGNVYVSSSGSSTVAVFPPGATKPARTVSNAGAFGLLAVSAAGALYLASGSETVAEVLPGGNGPFNTVAGPAGSLLLGAAISP